MRRRSAAHPNERQIAAVADGQHGVISTAQLADLGLGERGAAHRATSGRLVRVHPGVYALRPPGERGRWLAAVLACGDRAVLSHRSAAELWGLLPATTGPVHVTVLGPHRRGPAGVFAHRSTLAPDELAVHHGIPCTTVTRTLVDSAGQVDRTRLTRAIERAEEDRRFDLRAVEAQLERMRGRRGVGALRQTLARFDGSGVPASVAEQRFLSLVRRLRVPTPEVNAWIPLDAGGYRPDFLWRERRLIVEIDGRAHHARVDAFEHDRIRDRRLLDAGFVTVRFAAIEVLRQPRTVAAELRRLLDHPPHPIPRQPRVT